LTGASFVSMTGRNFVLTSKCSPYLWFTFAWIQLFFSKITLKK